MTRTYPRLRGPPAAARHVVGTGLGLFITRQLAQANGGDVACRRNAPSGPVFVLTLPASRRPG